MRNIPLKLTRQEQGSTLVVYLFILAALGAVAVAALQTTTLSMEASEAYKKGKGAFYSAEFGLDLAVNEILKKFEEFTPPPIESADQTALNSDTDWFDTVDYRNYAVKYKYNKSIDQLEPPLLQTIVGNAITYHYVYRYDIEAEATSTTGSSRKTLKEQIRILETPLVQYFAFYGQEGNSADMELFPRPNMNIWGRIHSNGSIYIGATGRDSKIKLRNYDNDGNMSPHSHDRIGAIFILMLSLASTTSPIPLKLKLSALD